MPVFHSLMQQFLAAESDSKRWLWEIGFMAIKPWLYKHSELLVAWGDRHKDWGCCQPPEWTIY
jgi:hypothetical protein